MYWYGCPSQLFPAGYKNTPFPKQYTILSNKWGAVHFASKELFLTARIACFEVALQFTRYDPRDPVPEGTAGGLASERWSYTFDSAVSIK